MFMELRDGVMDFDLDFLQGLLSFLDAWPTNAVDDDDAVHQLDYRFGLGFVASQRYVSQTSAWVGLAKRDALALGARVSGEVTVVQAVHAAANHWKHWEEDGQDPTRLSKQTREVLAALDCSPSANFVYVAVLSRLTQPAEPSLSRLVPWMKQWRDALPERGA